MDELCFSQTSFLNSFSLNCQKVKETLDGPKVSGIANLKPYERRTPFSFRTIVFILINFTLPKKTSKNPYRDFSGTPFKTGAQLEHLVVEFL